MQPNYANSISSMFITIFNTVTNWLNRIFNATGMSNFFLATILIVFLIRIFTVAIGYSSGSDKAKRGDNNE